MLTLGVDPGIDGAFAVLDNVGALVEIYDMPCIVKPNGRREINPAALTEWLRQLCAAKGWQTILYVERLRPMPALSHTTCFSMGDTIGAIRGIAAALNLAVQFVEPSQWKKHFKLGRDKEQARATATRLYPGAALSRKKDHNRAEALLVARYAQKERNGTI